MALTALFLVVMCGCVLYLMVWAFDKHRTRDSALKRTFRSFMLLNISVGKRALTGFLHAYVDDVRWRGLLLLAMEVMMLACTAWFGRAFKIKRGLFLQLFNQLARVLVNLILVAEVHLQFNLSAVESA